jgi:signal peptidase I
VTTPAAISIRDEGALDLIRSLLKRGISVRIRVTGTSMRPLLNGGEIVEVTPLASHHTKIGDILFFCDHKGNPFVHRLVRTYYYNGELYLQTKGDACADCDPAVPVQQVLGRVQRIITNQKNINLQTPTFSFRSRLLVHRTLLLFFLRRVKMAIAKKLLTVYCVVLYY